jgi:hypothetical protein
VGGSDLVEDAVDAVVCLACVLHISLAGTINARFIECEPMADNACQRSGPMVSDS